jgi:hypothetical protein
MLPASLIEWLTGLTKYEITSIIRSIGLKAKGALLIQNRLKNPSPFFTKPIIVTAIKTESARNPVTAI